MDQPAPLVESDVFFSSLRDRTARGVYTIALDGGQLPVSVQLQESTAVVFSFSGAVDRSKQMLPRFGPSGLHNYVPASVIGVSDPSLVRSDEMRVAWYAGHEGFELQNLLPDFFRQTIDSLGATRAAFVGSSGGGFAALYYSWKIPGSVAVVSNPQTNLNRYVRGRLGGYRVACWPSIETDVRLDTVIDIDLAPLYAERCDNTVLYLQEASDFFHLTWHFAPFVAALPHEHAVRLIVRVANWGERGHHPVPASIWIPWMTAALSAPDASAASIEDTWAEQNPSLLPPLKSLIRATGRDGLIAATIDEIWANENYFRPPPLKPLTHPGSRDAEIAAELARIATESLLGPRSSARIQ